MLPSPDTSYEKVSVFTFHWDTDQMGVEPLESKLLEVFKDVYNYDTKAYVVPVVNSHFFSLSVALNMWSGRCAGPNTLRIYVYAGHAEPGESTPFSACPIHIPKRGTPSIIIARNSKTRAMASRPSGLLPSNIGHRVLLSVHI